MANITGWGRGTWGQGPWSEPIPVEISGLAGTSALGTITVDAEANVSVTGQSATSAVAGVGVNAQAVATLPSLIVSIPSSNFT